MNTTSTSRPKKLTPLPSQIELFNAIAKKFGNRPALPRQINAMLDAATNILAAMSRPYTPSVPGEGLDKWRQSDDVGASSKWLAWVLSGGRGMPVEFNYPHDADDFSRCFKLLQAVPGMRGELVKLRSYDKPWDALAANWDVLEKLYDAGQAEELTLKIRALIGEKY